MKRKVGFLLLAFVFLAGCLAGCAGTLGGGPLDNFMKLSPKGKATVAMDLYIKVFDDTKKVLEKATITDVEKGIAIKKIELLKKFKTVIKIYNVMVDQNQMPNMEDEEQLIRFVEELVAMGVSI